MERVTLYLKESYHELVKNVSWPTLAQLQESTIVVLITSVILALIVFLMDVACSVVFKNIYGVWGQ
ncbi:MAG: preprotein translocase subunit SecE [Saprospirales bacterium]|jgi:preprotein translocase subunit SecE|nr:preprotein translocase subunit SecE [Saprospirales bacterium]MBK8921472.1 preprotein translocase subunit SecE [Saprospirales bacterium]